MNRADRKRTRSPWQGLSVGVSLLSIALAGRASAVDYTFVSDAADPNWQVFDAHGVRLIPSTPENVCANGASPPYSPPSCPAGAVSYDWSGGPIWRAALPTPAHGAQKAKWIWAPKIDGKTPRPGGATFSFKHPFYTCGSPKDGTISIAADDTFQVFINNSTTPLGGFRPAPHGSDALSVATVPASSIMQYARNTVTITVANANFPCDRYQCNPAGFVFLAHFADSLDKLPQCPADEYGKAGAPGDVEYRNSCVRTCGCASLAGVAIGIWSDFACSTPPTQLPACKGFVYSTGPCVNGQQSVDATGTDPPHCEGWPPGQTHYTQSCSLPPPACTYTYSPWLTCRSDGTLYRDVWMSSPPGCTGNPERTKVGAKLGVGDQCFDGISQNMLGCCPGGDNACMPRYDNDTKLQTTDMWCVQ